MKRDQMNRYEGREEREGISGMAGDPQCVRVLGPFRQAPAQQGSRDNHQYQIQCTEMEGWREMRRHRGEGWGDKEHS